MGRSAPVRTRDTPPPSAASASRRRSCLGQTQHQTPCLAKPQANPCLVNLHQQSYRLGVIFSVLQDILYVPDLYGNLLSVLHLMHCSAKVCFLRENCCI